MDDSPDAASLDERIRHNLVEQEANFRRQRQLLSDMHGSSDNEQDFRSEEEDPSKGTVPASNASSVAVSQLLSSPAPSYSSHLDSSLQELPHE